MLTNHNVQKHNQGLSDRGMGGKVAWRFTGERERIVLNCADDFTSIYFSKILLNYIF